MERKNSKEARQVHLGLHHQPGARVKFLARATLDVRTRLGSGRNVGVAEWAPRFVRRFRRRCRCVDVGTMRQANCGRRIEEIVSRVIAGELPLFEVLMRRHNQRVYRTIRAILKDEVELEDVMQQT